MTKYARFAKQSQTIGDSTREGGPAWNTLKKVNVLTKGRHMNWDRIEGNWKQAKGKIKQQWGKLTNDRFDVVAGKRDQLVGQIQECYGNVRDEAELQVKEWEARNDDLFTETARRVKEHTV